MRGEDTKQTVMFSYVSPEERVPADHPLRIIRDMVDAILERISPHFATLYARGGRPSIAPEKLLRALLLQVLYTIRSERQLMEQLDYNILYRWFVGLNLDDPVWVPTVFTKNRERLLKGDIANVFLAEVLQEAEGRGWLSDEHFTVDGTLLEAWASHKSFQRKDGSPSGSADTDPGNPTVNFRKEKRSNVTHASVTDPECRLAKKSAGKEARLSYQGSVVIDNRHGLVVATHVNQPGYDAECISALEMMQCLPPPSRRRTLGGDKGYDREDLVDGLRSLRVTPHVAQNVHTKRGQSAIDGRTTRHAGYAVSQRKRKVVEETFGWGKVVGPLRKLHVRGTERVGFVLTFAMAVYDLVRMRTLSLAGGVS